MTKLNKVIENTLLYTLSSSFLRALSIILFPIFSFYLTKSDYGILSITQSITVIITSFSSLQINNAITRFIYDKSLKLSINNVLASGLITVVISNLLWVCLFLIFGEKIFKYFLNDISFYPYMYYSLISIFFTCTVDTYRNFLKSIHKGRYAFWYETLYYLTNIIFNLLFVVIFKFDVIGLVYSTIISGLIFTLYVFFKKINKIDFKPKITAIKAFLIYSVPLIPFAIVGFFLSEVDKFILNSYYGSEYNGIYYIAFTIAGLFSTFKESTYTSITPWFYEHFEKNKSKIKEVIFYIFTGIGILCIIISLMSKEVLTVISSNKEFIDAWKYVPFINFGLFIVFIGQILSLPTFYLKKTKYFFATNLGGLISTFFMAFLLIPKFGIYGAIIAKIIGYFIMTIIQYFMSLYYSKFKIEIFRVIILCSAVLILSMIDYISFLKFQIITNNVILSIKISSIILIISIYLKIINNKFYKDLSFNDFIKINLKKQFQRGKSNLK